MFPAAFLYALSDLLVPELARSRAEGDRVRVRHLTEKYQAEIFRIQTPNFSISSHNIRKRCAEQTSIRYLLPDRVREYIAANNLYCGAKKE